jgi:predicted lipoprotein with Yx(FWY)xxD motif
LYSIRSAFLISALAAAAFGTAGALASEYGDGYGAVPASAPPLAFKGNLLANANGMTVYTFDRDVAGSGKSACNADCAAKWPPVVATSSDHQQGQFTIVVRDDGSRQWAFNGKPVYTWVADKQPGDKSGDGVGNAWHVVAK